MKSAWQDVVEELQEGERIEAVIFGPWGWGGYREPDPPKVPHDLFGKVLKPEEAKQYMEDWTFYTDYGAPECYAAYIYTNWRIFFVVQYDGATWLEWIPRNPTEGIIPEMPGG